MDNKKKDVPKDVDGDPDEDNKDAADADHREHPVVHYLAIWVWDVMVQGDLVQLYFMISFWRALKNKKIL